MVPIVIYENGTELPEGNCYVICRDGVFLKKDTGLINAIIKVERLSFLKALPLSASMNIPKIPMEIFLEALLFFKRVYKKYKSEAVVLLYYDDKLQEFKLSAPEQRVSHSALKYTPGLTENGFKLIGSIHSHADFGAFHSSIDHHDEADFDGIHITIGNVNGRQSFSVSTELVVNNNRFGQDTEDWVLGVTKVKRRVRKTIPVNGGASYQHEYSPPPRFRIVFPEKKKMKDYSFPEDWMNRVKCPPPYSGGQKYFQEEGGGYDWRESFSSWSKEAEDIFKEPKNKEVV